MKLNDSSAFLSVSQSVFAASSATEARRATFCPAHAHRLQERKQRTWPSPATVTMLRVQDKRRPEDWDKRNSSLSGRFMPMDPREENVLDVLENFERGPSPETYGPEGPPSDAYGDSGVPLASRKWSKRSEAARKRWADPVYRAKMLEKRAEKRRRDDAASNDEPEKGHKLEIGCMDSIALSEENKANAINAYARSNQLRSEKITAFHRNRKLWMEKRLDDSPKHLSDDQYLQKKLDIQEKRRQAALKRAEMRRNRGTPPQSRLVGESKGASTSAAIRNKASAAKDGDDGHELVGDELVSDTTIVITDDKNNKNNKNKNKGSSETR